LSCIIQSYTIESAKKLFLKKQCCSFSLFQAIVLIIYSIAFSKTAKTLAIPSLRVWLEFWEAAGWLICRWIELGGSLMAFSVLVVEDDADSRDLLNFRLTREGYIVRTAGDGISGFHVARIKKPNVIITDLTLPEMSGLELIRQIRLEPEIAETQIVVYTAYTREQMEIVFSAGANRSFYKPLDIDKVIDYINELWKKSQKRLG
jgi:CheY-like chemotaxis protein